MGDRRRAHHPSSIISRWVTLIELEPAALVPVFFPEKVKKDYYVSRYIEKLKLTTLRIEKKRQKDEDLRTECIPASDRISVVRAVRQEWVLSN